MMRQCSVFFLLMVLVLQSVPFLVSAQATDSFTVTALYGNDNEPPTVPDPVTVTPLSISQIDVAWGASTDNVLLVGYQLFRDSVQIATTTLLSYNDTGLTPSTTYAYSVRAFDLFGNVSTTSTSVSTTTFALPPPPPSTPPQVSIPPPTLRYLDIDTGTERARFTLQTYAPVTYTLRYGTTDALEGGFVETTVFRNEHTTLIDGLTADTQYVYELYGTDRFGRERLLESGAFTTAALPALAGVPNVLFFSARVSAENVLLSWMNPRVDDFAYVRIVRNIYGYPLSPTDGFIVYEGPAESWYDQGALAAARQQYYTIFAYNIEGQYSSGAIATAVRGQLIQTGLPVESVTDVSTGTSTTATSAAPFNLTLNDVSIVQGGEVIAAQADVFLIDSSEPFVVRVPAPLVPIDARTLIITWQHPTIDDRKTSYLLRLNQAGTYFEAFAAAMDDTGIYPLRIAVFDPFTNELGGLTGALEVVGESTVATDERVVYIATTYLILGGIIGLLTVLGLWWLLLLLLRLMLGKKKAARSVARTTVIE